MPLDPHLDFYTIMDRDGREIVLADPDTHAEIAVKGMVTAIEAAMDPQTGQQVRAPKTAMTISMVYLVDASGDAINPQGWSFDTTDALGNSLTGRITDTRLDSSLGMANLLGESGT